MLSNGTESQVFIDWKVVPVLMQNEGFSAPSDGDTPIFSDPIAF